MKLWLDDLRPAPAGWILARSVREAKLLLLDGNSLEYVSLDHDLGDFASQGGDAPVLLDWMVEQNIWPSYGINVHSANPVGARQMLKTIDRYGPFPVAYGRHRGQSFKAALSGS